MLYKIAQMTGGLRNFHSSSRLFPRIRVSALGLPDPLYSIRVEEGDLSNDVDKPHAIILCEA